MRARQGYACIYTIAEALALANQGGKVSNASGVDINSQDKSRIPAALALGREADVIVLALGIDKTIEHEGVDRTSITLPGLQEPFAQQVLALGKPTVLVLVNGGEVAIDTLMSGPNAIVEAFNPNTVGTQALAATLMGKANRWGKVRTSLEVLAGGDLSACDATCACACAVIPDAHHHVPWRLRRQDLHE